MVQQIQNWIFNRLHNNKLIYNTCWEDPRCDRQLMNIQADSEIVMISSAGDNALDYLLDRPKAVHAVDMNYRQNALVEFKKALYAQADHAILFNFFGEGRFPDAQWVYKSKIRPHLPAYAQQYWDKHIKYFNGKGLRKSFYYRGTSGSLAFGVKNYLQLKKKIKQHTEALMNAASIAEQTHSYTALEQNVFTPAVSMVLNNNYTMYLAGVPKAQQALIKEDLGENVAYIKQCFRNVFTELDVEDNYFYQLYYRGKYSPNCCPEYLKANNFEALKTEAHKLSTYTTTLSGFLQENPGTYSHYVLLDHQDWLAAHDVAALEEEWELILANSRPGTRILMRSAASKIDFFPDFVTEKIDFSQDIQHIHQQDRVGTYASVYLGIVK